MFRGRAKEEGRWVTQELTDSEMRELLEKTNALNKEAMKLSVRTAVELRQEDAIKEEHEFQVALALFDKLGMQSFSVVNNRIQNMVD
jgi:hypothetical protein